MEDRPRSLSGFTKEMKTGCGPLYVTINFHEGRVFEAFAKMGKAGGCASSQTEAIGRLVSFAAREGMDLAGVVKQLSGIKCHQDGGKYGEQRACADALAQVLKEAIKSLSPDQEELEFVGGKGDA